MDAEPPEVVYKESCPYCVTVARTIGTLDLTSEVRLTPIESKRGEELVREHHGGELVMSPHLFGEKYVYFGVLPVAKAILGEYARSLRG